MKMNGFKLDQLNLNDEKRLMAVCHGQMYQKRMIKAFNKMVRRQVYQCDIVAELTVNIDLRFVFANLR